MSSWHALILGVYGGLWRAAAPFLRRHKRLGDGFEERLVPEGWPFAPAAAEHPAPALRLWIQAASGGEAWLTHSLLPAIARTYAARHDAASPFPPVRFLCTTFTRQGHEVLEKLTAPSGPLQAPGAALPRYFPLDRPDLMRRALRGFRPHGVILLETEIWPGLLSAAREEGIPVFVINGRMTEKSLSAYRLTAPFWRALAPQKVLAISEADARRFSALFGGACEVGVMPNIKFDRVAEGLERRREAASDADASLRAAACPENALLAVLASVREEEEDRLIPVLADLQGQEVDGTPLLLAVAPRHIHRIAAWGKKLRAAGIAFRLRSAGEEGHAASAPPPLYLWDTFGELRTLYGMADAVFVGGSLAPLGGQNFLEPLEQGVCPLVGPHLEHFLWVGEDFFRRGLAVRISGPDAMRDALFASLRERRAFLPERDAPKDAWRAARDRAGQLTRERFAEWLGPHTGGSGQAARAVLEALGRPGRADAYTFLLNDGG